MGVDLQVIKPPPPQCYYTLPIEIADKATRMVNDGLAEYAWLVALTGSSHSEPFRYRMAAAAAAELERCVRETGLQGRAES